MSFDAAYLADNTFSPVSLVHQLLPYPISRQEAELHWEMVRQKVRARIAALPSSSFERTMLEEDERFYATFPQARQAAVNAWIAQEFPYAPWAQSLSFTHDTHESMDISFDGSPKPTYTSVHAPNPAPDFSTFTLANALTFSPSRSEASTHRPLTIVYNASAKVTELDLGASSPVYVSNTCVGPSQGCDSNQQGSASGIVLESCPMAAPPEEPVLLALQVLAPARRTRPARNTRKVSLRPSHYTPPASNKRENVYPSTFFATPPESTLTSPSTPPPCEQLRYTGDWEADAIAATEYLHTSERIHTVEKPTLSILPPPSKKSKADASPTRAQLLSPRKDHLSPRPRPHPYTPHRSHSLSTSGEQSVSPAPRKRAKLLRDKDGKPIMACLFCRGRKIACGPPPEGSNDPTCNQCARRGLACHYPTESRRGQRKKKVDIVNAKSNDVSTLLDLYRSASLKDNDFHVTSDDSDSEWDSRDF